MRTRQRHCGVAVDVCVMSHSPVQCTCEEWQSRRQGDHPAATRRQVPQLLVTDSVPSGGQLRLLAHINKTQTRAKTPLRAESGCGKGIAPTLNLPRTRSSATATLSLPLNPVMQSPSLQCNPPPPATLSPTHSLSDSHSLQSIRHQLHSCSQCCSYTTKSPSSLQTTVSRALTCSNIVASDKACDCAADTLRPQGRWTGKIGGIRRLSPSHCQIINVNADGVSCGQGQRWSPNVRTNTAAVTMVADGSGPQAAFQLLWQFAPPEWEYISVFVGRGGGGGC